MTEYLTLHNIVLGLLVLSALWLIIVVIKKQNENLARALLLTVFFGGALIFINTYHITKLNLSDIREKVMPSKKKVVNYAYEMENGGSGKEFYTMYVFKEPFPKISLSMDTKGRFFHISSDRDIASINAILKYLGLPRIIKGVQELVSITGSQLDIYHYRWDDYPEGILVLERDRCPDRDSLQTYHCLRTITITKRY
jgi:hypothetical protein